MKRLMTMILCLSSAFLMSACEDPESESSSVKETVTLTFKQHDFITFHHDNGLVIGYYFGDVICETEFEYTFGYHLTDADIDSFNYFNLNVHVPELVGDGYWRFTFWATEFDEETGYATDPLKPMYLIEDMDIHFGIYG